MSNKIKVSIYDFSEVSEFLKRTFASIKQERPHYSIRAWSGKLELDPGSLSRILTGQRRIPKTTIKKICAALDLDRSEIAYFELLATGKDQLSDESFELLRQCLMEHLRKDSPSPMKPMKAKEDLGMPDA